MIQNIFHLVMEKLLPKTVIAALVGTTLVTSGVAGAKLITQTTPVSDSAINITAGDPQGLKEIPTVSPEPTKESPEVSNNVSANVNPTGSDTVSGSSNTQAATVNQQNSSATAATSQNANACIITLFGNQYDVASLRSTHPGGDIFACGTDMTAAYQKQHGTDLTRMQQYLVTGTSGSAAAAGGINTGISAAGPSSQIGSREDDHDNEIENETHNQPESSD